MEEYIKELIDIGLGSVVEVSVDKQISKDKSYQDNMEKAGKILDRFRPNLSQQDLELFEEYMDCILNANERACTVSYLVGAKNAISKLQEWRGNIY